MYTSSHTTAGSSNMHQKDQQQQQPRKVVMFQRNYSPYFALMGASGGGSSIGGGRPSTAPARGVAGGGAEANLASSASLLHHHRSHLSNGCPPTERSALSSTPPPSHHHHHHHHHHRMPSASSAGTGPSSSPRTPTHPNFHGIFNGPSEAYAGDIGGSFGGAPVVVGEGGKGAGFAALDGSAKNPYASRPIDAFNTVSGGGGGGGLGDSSYYDGGSGTLVASSNQQSPSASMTTYQPPASNGILAKCYGGGGHSTAAAAANYNIAGNSDASPSRRVLSAGGQGGGGGGANTTNSNNGVLTASEAHFQAAIWAPQLTVATASFQRLYNERVASIMGWSPAMVAAQLGRAKSFIGLSMAVDAKSVHAYLDYVEEVKMRRDDEARRLVAEGAALSEYASGGVYTAPRSAKEALYSSTNSSGAALKKELNAIRSEVAHFKSMHEVKEGEVEAARTAAAREKERLEARGVPTEVMALRAGPPFLHKLRGQAMERLMQRLPFGEALFLNNVDGQRLLALTEDDLVAHFGLPATVAKIAIAAIQDLKDPSAVDQHPLPTSLKELLLEQTYDLHLAAAAVAGREGTVAGGVGSAAVNNEQQGATVAIAAAKAQMEDTSYYSNMFHLHKTSAGINNIIMTSSAAAAGRGGEVTPSASSRPSSATSNTTSNTKNMGNCSRPTSAASVGGSTGQSPSGSSSNLRSPMTNRLPSAAAAASGKRVAVAEGDGSEETCHQPMRINTINSVVREKVTHGVDSSNDTFTQWSSLSRAGQLKRLTEQRAETMRLKQLEADAITKGTEVDPSHLTPLELLHIAASGALKPPPPSAVIATNAKMLSKVTAPTASILDDDVLDVLTMGGGNAFLDLPPSTLDKQIKAIGILERERRNTALASLYATIKNYFELQEALGVDLTTIGCDAEGGFVAEKEGNRQTNTTTTSAADSPLSSFTTPQSLSQHPPLHLSKGSSGGGSSEDIGGGMQHQTPLSPSSSPAAAVGMGGGGGGGGARPISGGRARRPSLIGGIQGQRRPTSAAIQRIARVTFQSEEDDRRFGTSITSAPLSPPPAAAAVPSSSHHFTTNGGGGEAFTSDGGRRRSTASPTGRVGGGEGGGASGHVMPMPDFISAEASTAAAASAPPAAKQTKPLTIMWLIRHCIQPILKTSDAAAAELAHRLSRTLQTEYVSLERAEALVAYEEAVREPQREISRMTSEPLHAVIADYSLNSSHNGSDHHRHHRATTSGAHRAPAAGGGSNGGSGGFDTDRLVALTEQIKEARRVFRQHIKALQGESEDLETLAKEVAAVTGKGDVSQGRAGRAASPGANHGKDNSSASAAAPSASGLNTSPTRSRAIDKDVPPTSSVVSTRPAVSATRQHHRLLVSPLHRPSSSTAKHHRELAIVVIHAHHAAQKVEAMEKHPELLLLSSSPQRQSAMNSSLRASPAAGAAAVTPLPRGRRLSLFGTAPTANNSSPVSSRASSPLKYCGIVKHNSSGGGRGDKREGGMMGPNDTVGGKSRRAGSPTMAKHRSARYRLQEKALVASLVLQGQYRFEEDFVLPSEAFAFIALEATMHATNKEFDFIIEYISDRYGSARVEELRRRNIISGLFIDACDAFRGDPQPEPERGPSSSEPGGDDVAISTAATLDEDGANTTHTDNSPPMALSPTALAQNNSNNSFGDGFLRQSPLPSDRARVKAESPHVTTLGGEVTPATSNPYLLSRKALAQLVNAFLQLEHRSTSASLSRIRELNAVPSQHSTTNHTSRLNTARAAMFIVQDEGDACFLFTLNLATRNRLLKTQRTTANTITTAATPSSKALSSPMMHRGVGGGGEDHHADAKIGEVEKAGAAQAFTNDGEANPPPPPPSLPSPMSSARSHNSNNNTTTMSQRLYSPPPLGMVGRTRSNLASNVMRITSPFATSAAPIGNENSINKHNTDAATTSNSSNGNLAGQLSPHSLSSTPLTTSSGIKMQAATTTTGSRPASAAASRPSTAQNTTATIPNAAVGTVVVMPEWLTRDAFIKFVADEWLLCKPEVFDQKVLLLRTCVMARRMEKDRRRRERDSQKAEEKDKAKAQEDEKVKTAGCSSQHEHAVEEEAQQVDFGLVDDANVADSSSPSNRLPIEEFMAASRDPDDYQPNPTVRIDLDRLLEQGMADANACACEGNSNDGDAIEDEISTTVTVTLGAATTTPPRPTLPSLKVAQLSSAAIASADPKRAAAASPSSTAGPRSLHSPASTSRLSPISSPNHATTAPPAIKKNPIISQESFEALCASSVFDPTERPIVIMLAPEKIPKADGSGAMEKFSIYPAVLVEQYFWNAKSVFLRRNAPHRFANNSFPALKQLQPQLHSVASVKGMAKVLESMGEKGGMSRGHWYYVEFSTDGLNRHPLLGEEVSRRGAQWPPKKGHDFAGDRSVITPSPRKQRAVHSNNNNRREDGEGHDEDGAAHRYGAANRPAFSAGSVRPQSASSRRVVGGGGGDLYDDSILNDKINTTDAAQEDGGGGSFDNYQNEIREDTATAGGGGGEGDMSSPSPFSAFAFGTPNHETVRATGDAKRRDYDKSGSDESEDEDDDAEDNNPSTSYYSEQVLATDPCGGLLETFLRKLSCLIMQQRKEMIHPSFRVFVRYPSSKLSPTNFPAIGHRTCHVVDLANNEAVDSTAM